MRDKGFNDIALHFLIKALPQYQHSQQNAGYERILRLMRSSNICALSLYKTEAREKDIVFSQARLHILPNGLIIRRADYSKFAKVVIDQRVHLPKLLADKSLIGGVADGRLYNGIIDDVIANTADKSNLVERSGVNVFSHLLAMLNMRRIDYTLGFPVELTYHQELAHYTQDMQFIPIEGMPHVTPIYAGCSRNKWGTQVIADINRVLQQFGNTEPALRQYTTWLSEAQRSLYQAAMPIEP
jgi:uncharacterized protein (TIGR02285 family)